MKKSKTVGDYIKGAPVEVQPKLKEIREYIKVLSPNAAEKISYGMPTYYGAKGMRSGFTSFAYFKDHLSIFATPAVLDSLNKEIGDLRTGKATLRIPLDMKLPLQLIKKIAKATIGT
jgi:uncharacterized protein YdhG (YjbR/CyaY superfamily)